MMELSQPLHSLNHRGCHNKASLASFINMFMMQCSCQFYAGFMKFCVSLCTPRSLANCQILIHKRVTSALRSLTSAKVPSYKSFIVYQCKK